MKNLLRLTILLGLTGIAAHAQVLEGGPLYVPSVGGPILGSTTITMTNAACNVLSPGSSCTLSALGAASARPWYLNQNLVGSCGGSSTITYPLGQHYLFSNSCGAPVTMGGATGATVVIPSGVINFEVNSPDGANYYSSASSSSSVSSVSASSPIHSTGEANPIISLSIVPATLGGTGLDTSSSTGFAQLSSGTWGFSALTSSQITTALGFTPYNSTNPSGYISSNGISGMTATQFAVAGSATTITSSVGSYGSGLVLMGSSPVGSAAYQNTSAFDASGAAAARAGTGTCTSGQYETGDATGGPACAQVAFSQLSGTPMIPTVASTYNLLKGDNHGNAIDSGISSLSQSGGVLSVIGGTALDVTSADFYLGDSSSGTTIYTAHLIGNVAPIGGTYYDRSSAILEFAGWRLNTDEETGGFDLWDIQDIVGSGYGPTSTLTFTHTGTSGVSIVALPSASTVGGSPICTTATGCTSYSPGPSDTTLTVGGITVLANTCTSVSTITMTGLTASMTLTISPSTDISGVTGWGPSGSTLYFISWPTSNTLNYYVCNPTGSTITTGSSTTWNVSAK